MSRPFGLLIVVMRVRGEDDLLVLAECSQPLVRVFFNTDFVCNKMQTIASKMTLAEMVFRSSCSSI